MSSELESITRHSAARATEEAVLLWALSSAQYPLDHRLIQDEATFRVIEAVSSFSLNARRALEAVPKRAPIRLSQPRWQWEPKAGGEVVSELWDALNRVVHARRLEVGWELLPGPAAVIAGGAIIVP